MPLAKLGTVNDSCSIYPDEVNCFTIIFELNG